MFGGLCNERTSIEKKQNPRKKKNHFTTFVWIVYECVCVVCEREGGGKMSQCNAYMSHVDETVSCARVRVCVCA